MIIKLLPYIFVILYLSVGFVPYLGSLDKYATQYLFLSGLNILVLGYLFSLRVNIKEIFKKKIFNLYSFFFLFGITSSLYAFNTTEVYVSSLRIFVYLMSIFNLFFLIKKLKNIPNFICLAFILISLIEVTYILYSFFSLYNFENYYRSPELRGFTGNINIAAFSILLKLPYSFFIIQKIKKHQLLIGTSFYFIIISTIFLLGSRGANLAVLIITLSLISSVFLFLKGLKNKVKKVSPVVLGLLLAIIFNSIAFYDNSISVSKTAIDISMDSTSERLRYYSQAFETFWENPVKGIGLGNWKIHSIKLDSKNIVDYVVPYHVHNDFLQFAAELGVIGITTYLFILFFSTLNFYKLLLNNKLRLNQKIFVLSALLSMLVYIIDSNLNFPYPRPIVYMPVILYLSLSMNLTYIKDE